MVELKVHGTARGGDCDELRLLSDETTIINLRAHGGSFSFLGTKVLETALITLAYCSIILTQHRISYSACFR